MPRKQRTFEESPRPETNALVTRLVEELQQKDKESGQPLIYEELFPTGKIRVVVIWDEWDRLSLEDRTAAILQAYERAEGRTYRDKIALASGLTVPEAHAAGMLPFEVLPAWRTGDPVTLEQCRQAMVEEGASKLFGPDIVQLRFATREEAEDARGRLVSSLPGSDQVWTIAQDVGSVEEWSNR
jgi:hypothetical protein